MTERSPGTGSWCVSLSRRACAAGPWAMRPKTADDQRGGRSSLVVGTGVDPVTFRFSEFEIRAGQAWRFIRSLSVAPVKATPTEPTGKLPRGNATTAGLKREVRKETRLAIEPGPITGVKSGPS